MSGITELYRNRGVNPLAHPWTMMTFAPTRDVFIAEGATTANQNTAGWLQCTPAASWRAYTIMRFDLYPSLPLNFVVTSATLRLHAKQGVTGRTITVYQLLRSDFVEAEATWNVYKAGSNWGTAGGLNVSTDYTTAQSVAVPSVATNAWLEAAVTNQVKTAFATVSGIALFRVADDGESAALDHLFHDREYAADVTLRPQLVVSGTLYET